MKNFWLWLYGTIILSGWINVFVIFSGFFVFAGLIFGTTNATGLGSSSLAQVIRLWVNYYLWAWLAIPSIIAIRQAIKNEKRERDI